MANLVAAGVCRMKYPMLWMLSPTYRVSVERSLLAHAESRKSGPEYVACCREGFHSISPNRSM